MPGRDKFDLQSSATFSTDTLYYIGSTTENLQESGLLGDTYVSKMKEFGKGLSTASFFCSELLLALTRAALYKRSRSSISVKEEGDLLWPKFRAEQELQEKLGDIKCLFFPASEMGHVVGLSWLLGHKKRSRDWQHRKCWDLPDFRPQVRPPCLFRCLLWQASHAACCQRNEHTLQQSNFISCWYPLIFTHQPCQALLSPNNPSERKGKIKELLQPVKHLLACLKQTKKKEKWFRVLFFLSRLFTVSQANENQRLWDWWDYPHWVNSSGLSLQFVKQGREEGNALRWRATEGDMFLDVPF